jgi:hypothetical protein
MSDLTRRRALALGCSTRSAPQQLQQLQQQHYNCQMLPALAERGNQTPHSQQQRFITAQ